MRSIVRGKDARRRRRRVRPEAALGLALFAALAAEASWAALPPIVFVSRTPASDPAVVLGLGPSARAAITGGKLLLREPHGRVRELPPPDALFDVSDPAVSPDARRIACAGVAAPDSAWRIYVMNADGSSLRAATVSDRVLDRGRLGASAARFGRYDDLDPCWIDDTLLCFASTRYPQRAQYADLPVTNLFLVSVPRSGPCGPPKRLTSERNGAEEPVFDPASGRIVYTRWWFNRHHPTATGITTDPSLSIARDSVNLWQAVEIRPDGSDLRLACGSISDPRGTMAYQPAILADGSLVGVYAGNLGLEPHASGLGIQRFAPRLGSARRVTGALIEEGSAYGSPRGLVAPAACAPVGLPDGRILFSFRPGGRGDFGLFAIRADGTGLERIVDLPRHEDLDAALLIPRRPSRARELGALAAAAPALPDLPASDPASLDRRGGFRYRCLNAFAEDTLDSPVRDAPRPAPGARVRFFAALARPEESGGDTAVLIREAPIGGDGSIDESGLPADVPMFEQLVDRDGRLLLSAHAPAHVAGLNAGRPGGESLCIGCHRGHTTMLRRGVPSDPRWFDVAPGASASSLGPRENASAAVDRRTRGPVREVAWISTAPDSARLTLAWPLPVEARAVVLYGIRPDGRAKTDLAVRGCDLTLSRLGRPVERVAVGAVKRGGTRVALPPTTFDTMEIRVTKSAGRVQGRRATGLAEVVVTGRLAPD